MTDMTVREMARKGGLVKCKKGLAMLSPERRLEIQRKGGQNSWKSDKRRREKK